MALKPQMAEFLQKVAALNLTPVAQLDPVAARAQMEATVKARNLPPIEVGSVEDRNVPGPSGDIPVRFYHPAGADGPLPALVYFHGGGHVIGSLDTHDAICRALCKEAGIVVMSVDYRMGPEARFPAAVDDSYAATRWLADHGASLGVRTDRIAVGGDSAGGNLALVVSLLARDTGAPKLAFQLLVYPVMDYSGGTPTYETYGKGYGPLEADTMAWFRDHYVRGPEDLKDWRASPRLAESLGGLPKTLLLTAECDVLAYEGQQLAKRLKADGVDAEHVDFPGMIHAFFGLAPMIEDGVKAQELAADRLKKALFA